VWRQGDLHFVITRPGPHERHHFTPPSAVYCVSGRERACTLRNDSGRASSRYAVPYVGRILDKVFYTEPLLQALHDPFNRLLQAGMMEFWELAFKIEENRRLSIIAVTNMDNNIETEIESMNSSIESLFQIFLILHSVNMICLVAEMIYVKLKAQWNLLIIKRKNRKAIWSLGKI